MAADNYNAMKCFALGILNTDTKAGDIESTPLFFIIIFTIPIFFARFFIDVFNMFSDNLSILYNHDKIKRVPDFSLPGNVNFSTRVCAQNNISNVSPSG